MTDKKLLEPDERAAIAARCEAATPGPWMITSTRGLVGGVGTDIDVAKPRIMEAFKVEDRDFIEAARTDVPTLLAALDAAETAQHATMLAGHGVEMGMAEAWQAERDEMVAIRAGLAKEWRGEQSGDVVADFGGFLDHHRTVEAERDALRADVERLTRERDEWKTPAPLENDTYLRQILSGAMEAVRACDEVQDAHGLCSCARAIGEMLWAERRMHRPVQKALLASAESSKEERDAARAEAARIAESFNAQSDALGDARAEIEQRYDCHGGPGTTTPACDACVTCLNRVLTAAQEDARRLAETIERVRVLAVGGTHAPFAVLALIRTALAGSPEEGT